MKESDIKLSDKSMDILGKLLTYGLMVISNADSEQLKTYRLISLAGEMHYYENGEVNFGSLWGLSSRGRKLLTVDDKYVKKWLALWAKQDGLIDDT